MKHEHEAFVFMSQLCETQHNQKLRIHSVRPGIVIGFTNVRCFDCPIIMITTRILFWKPHRRNAIAFRLLQEKKKRGKKSKNPYITHGAGQLGFEQWRDFYNSKQSTTNPSAHAMF